MPNYEIEISGSRGELAAVLTGVADGVRAGSIGLGEGEDAVAVDVPADLALEIELETGDGDTSLELELEWPASEESPATASPSDESTPDDATTTDTDVSSPEDSSDSSSPDRRGSDGDGQDTAEDTRDRIATLPADGVEAETAVRSDPPVSEVVDVPEGSRSLARFEIFLDRGSEWRWRLRHRNGNIIATSGEGYTQKHNAWKGLRCVMANAPEAAVTDESS